MSAMVSSQTYRPPSLCLYERGDLAGRCGWGASIGAYTTKRIQTERQCSDYGWKVALCRKGRRKRTAQREWRRETTHTVRVERVRN